MLHYLKYCALNVILKVVLCDVIFKVNLFIDLFLICTEIYYQFTTVKVYTTTALLSCHQQ